MVYFMQLGITLILIFLFLFSMQLIGQNHNFHKFFLLFGPHLNLLLQGGSCFLIIIFELAKRVVFGGVEQN